LSSTILPRAIATRRSQETKRLILDPEALPQSNDSWRACLKQAMDIAAATCRNAGGALILPTPDA
jgi:hypothetical protein